MSLLTLTNASAGDASPVAWANVLNRAGGSVPRPCAAIACMLDTLYTSGYPKTYASNR